MSNTSGTYIPAAEQLRAARAWLNWTLSEAEQASGVNMQTISRCERGGSSLETHNRLAVAYAAEGIIFEPGAVRMGERPVKARKR